MYIQKRPQHRQFRPVKSVPKHVVLAAIAKSKSTHPVQNETPVPTIPFDSLPIEASLKATIKAKGYSNLTPIQQEAIPAILQNRDVIGIAQTGTGKTAAFLIPLVQKCMLDRAQRVLIIAPTRELAYQIVKELREFSRGLHIGYAMLIGGASQWRQIQDMKADPAFVVATPGRLKDFVDTKVVRLGQFRTVVLDEADRMVDIGFFKEIQFVISQLPKERQSLFFSATVTGKAGELLSEFVTNPVRISIRNTETADQVKQDAVYVPKGASKIDTLHSLLTSHGFTKVLVFGRTKHGVQRLADTLSAKGLRVGAIHGNKRQGQRQQVLDRFMSNQIQILLATDVASRGLDIPDVSHVINYDLPESFEDYVHRIGRTGRATKRGIALTFID